MSGNGFGIPEDEYKKLKDSGIDFTQVKNNASYFRGLIVAKVTNLEKIKEKQQKKLDSLPCSSQGGLIKFAIFLIVVLYIIIGYNNFPGILRVLHIF